MNIINLMPKKLKERYESNIRNSGTKISYEKYILNLFLTGLVFSALLSTILFFFGINPAISFILIFFIMQLIFYLRIALKASYRIRKMENVFPDFIQLMSSNLRAGMTIDRAFLASARIELSPLDAEIMKTGGDIATGEDVNIAFASMAKRINSEKIEKTVKLIISGIKSGGNIATLLETTSSNMREKEFLEKRAASNVLMYVIFIFAAIGVGAPILFGLSSILIEVITTLTMQLPSTQATQMNLPFTFSKIGLSSTFVIYFSVSFLICLNIISSLIIGLVNKGDEKYGLKYILPMLVLSLSLFFAVRIFLFRFLAESFAIVS